MSLARRLREALERGHRRTPILLAGDVLEGSDGEIMPAAVLVAVVVPEPNVIMTSGRTTCASIQANSFRAAYRPGDDDRSQRVARGGGGDGIPRPWSVIGMQTLQYRTAEVTPGSA